MNHLPLLSFAMTFVVILAMLVGLRTMQEERLFSGAHRIELGLWFMYLLYQIQALFLPTSADLMAGKFPPAETPILLQLIVLGLMIASIMKMAALTLGNPPRVVVRVNRTAKRRSVYLEPITNSPGLVSESETTARMVL